jgi:hypothetical protein
LISEPSQNFCHPSQKFPGNEAFSPAESFIEIYFSLKNNSKTFPKKKKKKKEKICVPTYILCMRKGKKNKRERNIPQ